MDNKTSVQQDSFMNSVKNGALFHRVPVSDAAISMRRNVCLEVLIWYLMFSIINELYQQFIIKTYFYIFN